MICDMGEASGVGDGFRSLIGSRTRAGIPCNPRRRLEFSGTDCWNPKFNEIVVFYVCVYVYWLVVQ